MREWLKVAVLSVIVIVFWPAVWVMALFLPVPADIEVSVLQRLVIVYFLATPAYIGGTLVWALGGYLTGVAIMSVYTILDDGVNPPSGLFLILLSCTMGIFLGGLLGMLV